MLNFIRFINTCKRYTLNGYIVLINKLKHGITQFRYIMLVCIRSRKANIYRLNWGRMMNPASRWSKNTRHLLVFQNKALPLSYNR